MGISPTRYSIPGNSRNGRCQAKSAPTTPSPHPNRLSAFRIRSLVPRISLSHGGLGARLQFRGTRGVREFEAGEISQLQDLRHLLEVDLLHRVRDLVVVGVEAGEPPYRRNIVLQQRIL